MSCSLDWWWLLPQPHLVHTRPSRTVLVGLWIDALLYHTSWPVSQGAQSPPFFPLQQVPRFGFMWMGGQSINTHLCSNMTHSHSRAPGIPFCVEVFSHPLWSP